MNNLTVAASQRILDALAARQKNGSVFTAYDVTTDARDGTDDRIDHSDVQNIVHNEWQTGQFPSEFNRDDMVELNSIASRPIAIMYYPDGKSPSDHPLVSSFQAVPSAVAPLTGHYQAAPAVAAPNITSPKLGGSVKDGDGYICSETNKGVINIPDVIVKGVTPNGGNYDISVTGGKMIYKAPDGDGRLRISSSKLGGGNKFRLTIENNTITVTQA
jgi:hypothetical protein